MVATNQQKITVKRRLFIIFSIVFAGEIIFSLPFHVARFFRPTLLDVFALTNAQLGDIFAVYGVMAMLAYFPGGTIADRFSGRQLMSFSLFATALGGIYFVQIPGKNGLAILFGYWGVTTILLFWASMIKVTRQWGGDTTQGKAFGILDGGRGLVAAATASIAVLMFSLWLPANHNVLDIQQQRDALKTVIILYSLMTIFAALIVLFAIPKDESPTPKTFKPDSGQNVFDGVVKQPKVWCQAMIVLTAYCTYKGLDYFGLYVTQVLGFNEIDSARLIANASYLRPVAAISAGILADRLRASSVISWCFFLLCVGYLLFSVLDPDPPGINVIIEINLLFSFFLVFAIRGIYFALLQESKVSGSLTGTSVGLVSVVGFTPDIFFAPVTGRILDSAPGIDGFNRLFLLLASLTILGGMMSYTLAKRIAADK